MNVWGVLTFWAPPSSRQHPAHDGEHTTYRIELN